MNTRDLVLSALFAAIIVALGLLPPISVGLIPVPITAQSLGVTRNVIRTYLKNAGLLAGD